MNQLHLIGFLAFALVTGRAFATEPETTDIYFDQTFALGPNLESKYPEYIAGIEESGGYFNTAEQTWSVSSSASFGVGWLALQLNRSALSSDIALVVLVNAYEDTDLAIQLFNDRGEIVAVDLFANVIDSIKVAETDVCVIPLMKYPDAASIVIRRIRGRVEVKGCVLFPVIGEVINTQEEYLELISQLGDIPSKDYYNFLHAKPEGEAAVSYDQENVTNSKTDEYETSEASFLGQNLEFTVFDYSEKRRPTDVYFIPLFGFPNDLANELAEELQNELDIKIVVSVHMGLSPYMYNAEHKQYDVSRIAEEARIILKRISYQKEIPFAVVLTEKDINAPPFNLRYNFATWLNDVSVVSTARMDPRSYGAEWNRELLYNRFKKMVKKHLGYGYYKYPSSTNPQSVMYSPIMGLDGLDQIGLEY